jgi:hypothetical protein
MKLALALGLSRNVEATKVKEAEQQREGETQPLLGDAPAADQPQQLPHRKKGVFASIEKDLWSLVIRLFILFGLDSFASGLASLSWMTYFFRRKFSLPEGQLGTIFFVTSIIAALSTLVASSVAKRIGNIKVSIPDTQVRRILSFLTLAADHGLHPSPVSHLPVARVNSQPPSSGARAAHPPRMHTEHGRCTPNGLPCRRTPV